VKNEQNQAAPDAGAILPHADQQVNTGLRTGTVDTGCLPAPNGTVVTFPSLIAVFRRVLSRMGRGFAGPS
jgi:hypothetical protein